jgi:hypothetical protein
MATTDERGRRKRTRIEEKPTTKIGLFFDDGACEAPRTRSRTGSNGTIKKATTTQPPAQLRARAAKLKNNRTLFVLLLTKIRKITTTQQ